MSDSTRPSWIPQWTIADRLRKIRRDSHLSQEDFATLLGVKATTYAAWEVGRNTPERILELAEIVEREFDVPAAWLLGLLDRPKAATDYTAPIPHQRRRRTDRVACVV